jgi:hypothetical protein
MVLEVSSPFQRYINANLVYVLAFNVRIPQQVSSARFFEILTSPPTLVFPNRISLGVWIACLLVHFQIRSFISKSAR